MMKTPACIIIASAPGSLMLLGEHAVLHGKRALVCAIDRRITVRLSPRSDHTVLIHSTLGEYSSPLDELADHPSFRFILQALRQHAARIPCGIELNIDSEFSADIGFGSSAAVTVATHAALTKWLTGRPPDPPDLFSQALQTVHAVQGRGSGADLAASIFGGAVAFTTQPRFDPVEISLPLTAVYCGYKTPTPEVIKKVDVLRTADPEKYDRIFSEIDQSVGNAIVALRDRNIPAFGTLLNRNHELMDAMGVNTPELQEIVTALQANPYIAGAKISGSGLGDCAIALGRAKPVGLDYPVYNLKISPEGFGVETQSGRLL